MDDKKTLMFFGGQTNSTPQQAQPHTPAHAQPPMPQAPVQQAPMPQQAYQAPPQQPQQAYQPPAQQPQAPQQPHAYQAPPQGYQHQQPRPNQPAQPAWGGYQQGGFGGANMAQHLSKKKIILGIVGAIALAVLGVGGTYVKNKYGGGKSGKFTVSYTRLGIDKNKANVDQLIVSLEKRARRWRKDAVWFGLTMYGVRPDGTVDLTDNGGAAIVKFVSPRGVQSHAKSVRKDSIKEYRMTRNGAKSDKIIGAKKAWKDFRPVSIPDCKVTDLVAALNKRGFKSGTVRIGFDVKFAFASGWAWTVDSKDKNLSGFYSMADCSLVKAR